MKNVLLIVVLVAIMVSTGAADDTHTHSSNCLSELKRTCRVNTDHGTYYVPDGWRETTSKQALLIDLGGPGVLPGSLERFDYRVLPDSIKKDKLVILLGAGWGTQKPTKACLDELEKHVAYSRGTTNDDSYQAVVNARCEFDKAAKDYASRSAALVNEALDDWNIESYQVVGASFAASRWQAMLGSGELPIKPDNVTVVSPLHADTSMSSIATWQAKQVSRVWHRACAKLSKPEVASRCNIIISKLADRHTVSGLMMLAWSPTATEEFIVHLEQGIDQLAQEVKKLSDRYYFLNAVDYPRSELFEYFAGVCSSIAIDTNDINTAEHELMLAHKINEMLIRFYSICSDLNQAYSDTASASGSTPTCYIELANERVTPPLVMSPAGTKSITFVSDEPYYHGDLRVLEHIEDYEECRLPVQSQSNKTVELAPGLIDNAFQRIGPGKMMLPVLSNDFVGEFHLAQVMVNKQGSDGPEILVKSDKNAAASDVVTGYCLSGWLIPDNGEIGRSYTVAIGLNQSDAPVCDIQPNLKRTCVSAGDLSICEAFSCDQQKHCQIRSEVVGLTNKAKAIQLM